VARNLESTLDAVPDGVVLLDANGDVEFLNHEACRILETSAEMALGVSIDAVVGVDHPIAKLSRIVLASGRAAIEREQVVDRRLAGDVVVEVAASPLLEGHTVDGVALMLRDCAIQNNLQEIVAQREALSSFGRIAAGIAHEVKNPLGGIRGAAEILAVRAQDAKSRSTAELIIREVDRIALLVDDFAVLSRGEELRLVPANIHRVIDDVLALTDLESISARVVVERNFDPSIPELLGDVDRLSQVFLNLARNALQAMEEKGGELIISTRMTLDHRLSSADGHHRPTLLVEFADTGPGVEPAVLEKLATPFFTTRPDGTGLGLTVARHWVARHEGTLRVESTPGLGTTVRVALPITELA
jgi:two-component system nitrogen regulation sensor histidine kinase GlnL